MKNVMQKTSNPAELAAIAKQMRREVIQMITDAKSGHPGGSLSVMEIVVTLFMDVMNHDPANPKWKDRDRFILSKGHCCPALYTVMAECGYSPQGSSSTPCASSGSDLPGPSRRAVSSPPSKHPPAPLGEGLSLGLGMALAAKLDKNPRVYVVLGDGEIQEGQRTVDVMATDAVWESAMFGAMHHVDNIVAIVDRNKIQLDGFVADIMALDPLPDKWRSFGWHVIDIPGNDIASLQKGFAEAAEMKGKPSVILADTIKGKGVSFMENNPKFHGTAPTPEECTLALKELA